MSRKLSCPDEMEFDDTGCLSDGLHAETKPIYFPDYQKVNPCCEPAWRWQRGACLDEDDKEYSSTTDDRETGYALKFIRELRACKSAADREALAKRARGLYSAYQIYTEGGRVKWVIQARILAGQSVGDVAQAMGISKDTVWWFQKLFFHVVPRLNAWDYIRLKIIGKTACQAISPDDTETLLKLFGFYGGPHVLDLVMSYLLSECGDSSNVTNVDPKLAEKISQVIELLSNPNDESALLKLFQASGELPDGERALEGLEDGLDMLLKLSAMEDDASPPASEHDTTELEEVVGDALAFDLMEEYESSQPPYVPEKHQPDWFTDLDEDLWENA